jgi:hypothetical protein
VRAVFSPGTGGSWRRVALIVLIGGILAAVIVVLVVRHGSETTAAPKPPAGTSGPAKGHGSPGGGTSAGNGSTEHRPEPPPRPKPPLPRHRILWGAWIGSYLTGTEAPWDMRATKKFERLAGKGLSLIHFSSPFAACRGNRCASYNFPVRAFESVRRYGAIPFFSWGSSSAPIQTYEPSFTLGSLIDGSHDAYIRAWAEAAKSWGHPFFLQFDWEMNGKWYPWGEGANDNKYGQFVLAWRHVHDVFTSVGATNATWVWCPNIDPNGSFTPLYSLYPGNAYVDWTCLNGYNRNNPWQSFSDLFGSSYRLLQRIAPTKPIIIGEIASTEIGGSKAQWIDDLLSTELPSRYPLIRGLLWFEKYAGNAYPIETSRASRLAFARGIASPVYVPSVFASLHDGPIRPPGR